MDGAQEAESYPVYLQSYLPITLYLSLWMSVWAISWKVRKGLKWNLVY